MYFCEVLLSPLHYPMPSTFQQYSQVTSFSPLPLWWRLSCKYHSNKNKVSTEKPVVKECFINNCFRIEHYMIKIQKMNVEISQWLHWQFNRVNYFTKNHERKIGNYMLIQNLFLKIEKILLTRNRQLYDCENSTPILTLKLL